MVTVQSFDSLVVSKVADSLTVDESGVAEVTEVTDGVGVGEGSDGDGVGYGSHGDGVSERYGVGGSHQTGEHGGPAPPVSVGGGPVAPQMSAPLSVEVSDSESVGGGGLVTPSVSVPLTVVSGDRSAESGPSAVSGGVDSVSGSAESGSVDDAFSVPLSVVVSGPDGAVVTVPLSVVVSGPDGTVVSVPLSVVVTGPSSVPYSGEVSGTVDSGPGGGDGVQVLGLGGSDFGSVDYDTVSGEGSTTVSPTVRENMRVNKKFSSTVA